MTPMRRIRQSGLDAFPTRTEQAPTVVYASWLVAFTLLLVLAFWAGNGRIRTGLGLSLVIACVTPLLLSLMTMSSETVEFSRSRITTSFVDLVRSVAMAEIR